MNQFDALSREVANAMSYLSNSINEISKANTEGAEENQKMAESLNEVMHKLEEISSLMDVTKESFNNLLVSVKEFVV